MDRISGRVDHVRGGRHDDQSGHEPNRRVGRGGPQGVERPGPHHGIGIDEDQHVTTRGLRAEVATGSEAVVARCRDQANPGEVGQRRDAVVDEDRVVTVGE